jgi:hypothetical protein
MLSASPRYSSISIHDPPEYSIAIEKRPPSPSPPYVVSADSFATSHPPGTESQSTRAQLYYVTQCIESRCALTWILFLISFALLHLVLAILIIKCPLPETYLYAICRLFFFHILFLIVMIIICCYQCISKISFTLENGLLATMFYFMVPTIINIPASIYPITRELIQLNVAIQSPSYVTDAYSCSLSFYRLVFGLTICNYVGTILCVITLIIYIIYRCLTCRQRHFNMLTIES